MEKLDAVTKATGRYKSDIVETALQEYLEKIKK
jgi:predicted DNA-binding protein